MAYPQASLALELYRPTIGRYAPFLIAFCFAGALWVAVDVGSDGPLVVNEPAREPTTIKSGELDVPAYYFPDAATGTDQFVDVRPSDCGGTSR